MIQFRNTLCFDRRQVIQHTDRAFTIIADEDHIATGVERCLTAFGIAAHDRRPFHRQIVGENHPVKAQFQRAPVALQNCLPLPDALDDIQAAAMANPGMSAWASLVTRAQLQAGETVLINGATGSAGQLAVQIARYLGAKKIIATGRNAQSLAALDADECIQLTADDKTLSGQFSAVSAAQIDVVIDYLWGHSAELLLPALAKYTPAGSPVRYVQVGSLAGADIALNGAVLRSAPLLLMGSGIGSLSVSQLLAATGEMLQAAVPGKLTIATTPRPLQEIAAAWPQDDSQKRTVFTLG